MPEKNLLSNDVACLIETGGECITVSDDELLPLVARSPRGAATTPFAGRPCP